MSSSSIQQRKELHDHIWDMANKVRGAVDGWDFKQYVLGMLFYRFISEDFANFVDGKPGYNAEKAAQTAYAATIHAATTHAATTHAVTNHASTTHDAAALAIEYPNGEAMPGASAISSASAMNSDAALLSDSSMFSDDAMSALVDDAVMADIFAGVGSLSDLKSKADRASQGTALTKIKPYQEWDDSEVTLQQQALFIKSKGYFIAPSQLFVNVAAKYGAKQNEDKTQAVENAFNQQAHTSFANLNVALKEIFKAIEDSSLRSGNPAAMQELFHDFDVTSLRLGDDGPHKSERLRVIMEGVLNLDLGGVQEHQIDLFGDAYEFLLSNYAANAGKSGGEFFTPQCVSALLAKIALTGLSSVKIGRASCRERV